MISKDLFPLVEPCCETHGAHLIDIVLRGKQARPVVEIFVDAEAGVTSDLCSAISRDVGTALEERDSFPESYTLIISSPGIDRSLKYGWQFKKHLGRTLALKMKADPTAQTVTGKLTDASADTIVLRIGDKDAVLPLDTIEEAIVKPPW
jgi:ribosome maturation factor RimP